MTEQLDAAGIRASNSAKRLQREAYKAWLVGLLFSTISGTYSLFQLQQREQTIDKKEGEGVVESKRLERFVSRAICCFGTGALLIAVVADEKHVEKERRPRSSFSPTSAISPFRARLWATSILMTG